MLFESLHLWLRIVSEVIGKTDALFDLIRQLPINKNNVRKITSYMIVLLVYYSICYVFGWLIGVKLQQFISSE